MAQAGSDAASTWRGWAIGLGVAAIVAIPLAPVAPAMLERVQQVRLHAPDWALWARQPPMLKAHVLAALAAVAIGAIIMLSPKGRGMHKPLGWAWVAAMGLTAVSSLFLTGLNGNSYSLIHLLSGWTLIALPLGVIAIRRRKVATHRRAMTAMFLGGLLIAGALAFLPGRFMFNFFFS